MNINTPNLPQFYNQGFHNPYEMINKLVFAQRPTALLKN